jgi:hypothetical protein
LPKDAARDRIGIRTKAPARTIKNRTDDPCRLCLPVGRQTASDERGHKLRFLVPCDRPPIAIDIKRDFGWGQLQRGAQATQFGKPIALRQGRQRPQDAQDMPCRMARGLVLLWIGLRLSCPSQLGRAGCIRRTIWRSCGRGGLRLCAQCKKEALRKSFAERGPVGRVGKIAQIDLDHFKPARDPIGLGHGQRRFKRGQHLPPYGQRKGLGACQGRCPVAHCEFGKAFTDAVGCLGLFCQNTAAHDTAP